MAKLKSKKTKKQGKVKNAQPNIYDGIRFRSKLETYTYKNLKKLKFQLNMSQLTLS